MRIETLLYVYLFICSGMIVFNIIIFFQTIAAVIDLL